MLTQTSIKRSLAYSTIAQMGFMMLQCGLGAYVSAMLHIAAHSLYKAHAFLSSGSVLEMAAATNSLSMKRDNSRNLASTSKFMNPGWLALGTLAVVMPVGVAWLVGSKTHPILGLILTVALAHLIWKSFLTGRKQVMVASLCAAFAVSASYFMAYSLLDVALGDSLSRVRVPTSTLDNVLLVLVATGFLGVFFLQMGIANLNHSRFYNSLYIHASNGFYFDIFAQKIALSLWR